MSLSIAAEKAAIPTHPAHAADGPCFIPKAAPVAHPAYTEFIMSVLPRIFSITHSDPINIAFARRERKEQRPFLNGARVDDR